MTLEEVQAELLRLAAEDKKCWKQARAQHDTEGSIAFINKHYSYKHAAELVQSVIDEQAKRIEELEADHRETHAKMLRIRAEVYRHGLHSVDPYEMPEYVDPMKDPEMRQTIKSFISHVLRETHGV